ncbi:MAG: CooT family nickel-binding protein [Desulfomonilaceae bacterium]|nr:CooT family nickel-binding protein [Desulfomonilaceae bacterium]
MCESRAYAIENGNERLIMESVCLVRPQEDSVLLRSLFGEETVIRGTLKELDLTGHKIIVEVP